MVKDMNQFIRIKCPFCGAVLKVKQQAGLEKASITCPVCKRRSLFSGFQKIVDHDAEKTELPEKQKTHPDYSEDTETPDTCHTGTDSEDTELHKPLFSVIGCLMERSGKRWALHPGVNTIGRKLLSSPQQVDIPVTDYTGEKKMSRCHAKIEVVRLPDGTCKHIIYNWQNKNATRVGGEPIQQSDRIVLHNGMTVRLANVDVRFVIDDPDATTI